MRSEAFVLLACTLSIFAATPPTFIQEAETAWTTDASATVSVTTGSFTVSANDIVVCAGITADNAVQLTITNSNTAQSWTQQQAVSASQYTWVSLWTAIMSTGQSMTVTVTRTNNSAVFYGVNCLTFRGSDGVGASSKTNVLSGAPSLALVTTANNSAIVEFSGDWNSVNGASRTWRTINGITPTSGNGLEVTYFRNAAQYTVYGAYWNDAGTAGSYTTGVSAPGGQKYSIAAVEIKGSASTTSRLLLLGIP